MIQSSLLAFLGVCAAGALGAAALSTQAWRALAAVLVGIGFLFMQPLLPLSVFRPMVPFFTGAAISGLVVGPLLLIRPQAGLALRAGLGLSAALVVHLAYLSYAISGA